MIDQDFCSQAVCGLGSKPTFCFLCREPRNTEWRENKRCMFRVPGDVRDWECPRGDRPWGYLPKELHVVDRTGLPSDRPFDDRVDAAVRAIEGAEQRAAQAKAADAEFEVLRENARKAGGEASELLAAIDAAVAQRVCSCTIRTLKDRLRKMLEDAR
jgi:hypothetical protein